MGTCCKILCNQSSPNLTKNQISKELPNNLIKSNKLRFHHAKHIFPTNPLFSTVKKINNSSKQSTTTLPNFAGKNNIDTDSRSNFTLLNKGNKKTNKLVQDLSSSSPHNPRYNTKHQII